MDFRELLVTEAKLPILNEYGRIQKNETAEYSRFDRDDAGTIKNRLRFAKTQIIACSDVSFAAVLSRCFETRA